MSSLWLRPGNLGKKAAQSNMCSSSGWADPSHSSRTGGARTLVVAICPSWCGRHLGARGAGSSGRGAEEREGERSLCSCPVSSHRLTPAYPVGWQARFDVLRRGGLGRKAKGTTLMKVLAKKLWAQLRGRHLPSQVQGEGPRPWCHHNLAARSGRGCKAVGTGRWQLLSQRPKTGCLEGHQQWERPVASLEGLYSRSFHDKMEQKSLRRCFFFFFFF